MPQENLVAEPLISVILPVYNGGVYLADSVQSVLNQDLKKQRY